MHVSFWWECGGGGGISAVFPLLVFPDQACLVRFQFLSILRILIPVRKRQER